jgi:hypothetical protein
MKRFTALHFTALATLWLGHASTCVALPEPHPDIAECDRKLREILQDDPNQSDVTYVATKFADPIQLFEDSAYDITAHYWLVRLATDNQRKPRFSNAQSREAERILSKYWDIPDIYVMDFGILLGSPEYFLYKCVADVCAPGGTCTEISPRQKGKDFIKKRALLRRFFNETMSWAKKVPRLRNKVPAFERSYNRADKKLRAGLTKLPERLYVNHTFVSRGIG